MSEFFDYAEQMKHPDYVVHMTDFQKFLISQLTRANLFIGPRRVGKTYLVVNHVPTCLHVLPYLNPCGMVSAPELGQVKDLYWDEAISNLYRYPQFKADNKTNEISWVRLKAKTGLMRDDKVLIKFRGMHKNPLSLRGRYIDIYVNDEFQDTNMDNFSKVIRPQLTFNKMVNEMYKTPRIGWYLFMGTARANHTEKMYYKYLNNMNEGDKNYMAFRTSASKLGHISKEELAIALTEMGPDDFNQEYECQFISNQTSKIFDKQLSTMEKTGRVKVLTSQGRANTVVAMDIGVSDATAVWFCQKIGNEYYILNFFKGTGLTPEYVLDKIKEIASKNGYNITHIGMPHDSKRRYFQTAGSISSFDYFSKFRNLFKTVYLDRWGLQDSINWTRSFLGSCYMNRDKCFDGMQDLKQYGYKWVPSVNEYSTTQIHKKKCNNSSDALRYLAQLCSKITLAGEWDIVNNGDMVYDVVDDYDPSGYSRR